MRERAANTGRACRAAAGVVAAIITNFCSLRVSVPLTVKVTAQHSTVSCVRDWAAAAGLLGRA